MSARILSVAFSHRPADPREQPVVDPYPPVSADVPPVPSVPEASPLRLHLAEEPFSDEELDRLDGVEAVRRLVDQFGGASVIRWVNFAVWLKGESL